jgi:hypothetical protein
MYQRHLAEVFHKFPDRIQQEELRSTETALTSNTNYTADNELRRRPQLQNAFYNWSETHIGLTLNIIIIIIIMNITSGRLCSLMVRVLGYRSRGPGSIPDTTRKKL